MKNAAFSTHTHTQYHKNLDDIFSHDDTLEQVNKAEGINETKTYMTFHSLCRSTHTHFFLLCAGTNELGTK